MKKRSFFLFHNRNMWAYLYGSSAWKNKGEKICIAQRQRDECNSIGKTNKKTKAPMNQPQSPVKMPTPRASARGCHSIPRSLLWGKQGKEELCTLACGKRGFYVLSVNLVFRGSFLVTLTFLRQGIQENTRHALICTVLPYFSTCRCASWSLIMGKNNATVQHGH